MNGILEANKILKSLRKRIIKLNTKLTLAVILVGHDPASKVYVNIKEKRAKELGVSFIKYQLPTATSEKKIMALINKLNQDKKITGILLQLPLPKKFNVNKIIATIAPEKDVDGLRFSSVILTEVEESKKQIPSPRDRGARDDKKKIIPPTIQSILHLIKLSKIKLAGKKAIILANSLEFAEPLKFLLEKKFKLKKLDLVPKSFTNYKLRITDYDLVIPVIGKKHFLRPNMIKKNSVIIDVGINWVGKKIYGDVDPACFKKTPYISPVPGGVGPLTVAYLFKNLLQLKNIK